MAIDAFLQFNKKDSAAGVDLLGETQDKVMAAQSPKPFQIKEWGFGITQKVNISSATGGMGAGKVEFDKFTVTKNIETASPAFFKNLCVGALIPEVTLWVRRGGGQAGKSGAIYFEINFATVFVTKLDWAHDDEAPTENIEFDYGALQISYRQQQPNGTLAAPVTKAWNKMNNTINFPVGGYPKMQNIK